MPDPAVFPRLGGPLAVPGVDDLRYLTVGYRLQVTFSNSFTDQQGQAVSSVKAWFTEISGLSADRDVQEVPEGGVNDHLTILPKGVKYGRVTLRRGIGDLRLWTWFAQGLYDCKVQRQTVTITMFNNNFSEMKQFTLKEAFPVKWSGPELKTDTNQVAVEILEFVHHGMAVADWAQSTAT